jgi:hypothetical protein
MTMERDAFGGGSDVGRDDLRDVGDEPPALIRDAPPDVFAPIDASAPVSGHQPPPAQTASAADTPEHDWSVAKGLVRPAFRPVGTQGLELDTIQRETLLAQASKSHAQPIVDSGPVGLTVVYEIPADGYVIVVNGDHVLSWGIEPHELQDAALANLAAWSSAAPWTEDTSGDRRLISSETGDGTDAVRILLPEAMAHVRAALGDGRIMIGLPERHLLAASLLRDGDDDFRALFSQFIVEQSGGADEPIDRRLFELVDGRLIDFV